MAIQHVLQFGFTESKSFLDAALLITESIAESKDTDTPLYIASLDIKNLKAFNVFLHPSMRYILQVGGVIGQWRLLKQDLMNGMFGKVKWEGLLSDPYEINPAINKVVTVVLMNTRTSGSNLTAGYTCHRLVSPLAASKFPAQLLPMI